MHYLSRREEKKRKERNGKLIICNYWRVSSARYDRWNRSYATKIVRNNPSLHVGEKKKKESIVIPPTPMFPKQELGDVLLCYGVHRVRATFDFQGHFQSWLIELPNLPRSLQNIYYTRWYRCQDFLAIPQIPKSIRATFKFPRDRRPFIARSLNRGGRAAKIEATSIETWWL